MAVTRFTRAAVAEVCRQLGPTLKNLPPGVNGATLLWAITGNESSFGANCTPKHEPAYDVGGRYASSPYQAPLLVKFGSAAACSYGPMQVMLCNAPPGSAPDDFDDLTTAIAHAVYALQKQLDHFLPMRIAEIGYCWNGGHLLNPNTDAKAYGARLALRYLIPMPAPALQMPVAIGSSLANAGKT
jgi:hypothetical protein